MYYLTSTSLFHSCLDYPLPSLFILYLQSSSLWPQERGFFGSQAKVYIEAECLQGVGGGVMSVVTLYPQLCLWVRFLHWLLYSQLKADCPKMLPDGSDRVLGILWWLLGQDALTHNPAKALAKAKYQRANADTGSQGKGKGVLRGTLGSFTSWVCLTLRRTCFTHVKDPLWEWGGGGRLWRSIVCPGLGSVGGALRSVQCNRNVSTFVSMRWQYVLENSCSW